MSNILPESPIQTDCKHACRGYNGLNFVYVFTMYINYKLMTWRDPASLHVATQGEKN